MLSGSHLALQARGFYYPLAGRIEGLPGQHNLAWEMSNDHRFRRERGGIAELIAEIKDRSETIILSSEDFSSALFQRAFREFAAALSSCGLEVTLVMYLRNQLEWMPRVYFTLIETGWGSGWHDTPSIWIDYGEILKRAVRHGNVIVRSYDEVQSVCSDFLSLLGLSLADMRLERDLRLNRSAFLPDYLRMFARNRLRRDLTAEERASIHSLVPADERRIRLSPAEAGKILERFGKTNRALRKHYNVPEPSLANWSDSSPFYVDELFSDRFLELVTAPRTTV